MSGLRNGLGADGIRAWRKSSRSYGGGNCVEVAVLYGERVCVRDSKNPHGAILRFSLTEWSIFMAHIRM